MLLLLLLLLVAVVCGGGSGGDSSHHCSSGPIMIKGFPNMTTPIFLKRCSFIFLIFLLVAVI